MSTFPTKSVEQLTPFGQALAGALGACFANSVVYPLDPVKTRLQAAAHGNVKGKGKGPAARVPALALLLKIAKEEGFLGLYAGYGASMLTTFSQSYAYFLCYSSIRHSYISRATKKLPQGVVMPSISTALELLMGAAAGALAQIFTIPVSVIATRQQVAGEHKAEDVDTSFLAIGREIIRQEGVRGLWTGIRASMVLTVNPAITYGMFERLKGLIVLKEGLTVRGKLTPWQVFLVGACSKTLATIVTYPYIMAKIRMQAKKYKEAPEMEGSTLPLTAEHTGPGTSAPTFAEVASDEPPSEIKEKAARINSKAVKHVGATDLLYDVWKREGFVGWYQGMPAQITKAVICQAMLFMMKDQFEGYALMLILLWRRLTTKLPMKN